MSFTAMGLAKNLCVALVVLTAGVASASFAQQTSVAFDVCAESVTWTRPSPDVQAKIWNDPRYAGVGQTAYEWTHEFVSTEPDSASLPYHSANLAGLWTDPQQNRCLRRDGEHNRWTEISALNYHVVGIDLSGAAYTVTVTRRVRGYEIIQFRRPDSLGSLKTTLRFIEDQGRLLAEWEENRPKRLCAIAILQVTCRSVLRDGMS